MVEFEATTPTVHMLYVLSSDNYAVGIGVYKSFRWTASS